MASWTDLLTPDQQPGYGGKNSAIAQLLLQQSMDNSPIQSPVQGLARLAQAYVAKGLMQKDQQAQTAGNASLAQALAPEKIETTGGGPSSPLPIGGGQSIDYTPPEISRDVNGDKRSQIAALLNGGAVSQQSLAPQLMDSLGIGAPKPDFTLNPGGQRFDGSGKQIASIPEKNNPNQAFNADGTPNKPYQDYEAAKMKAQQAPQWANVAIAQQGMKDKESALIDPETRRFMAEQILSGDKSPFANIGRGTQGGQNIALLRQEVTKLGIERGLKGSDLAALNAEFAGLQSGERTLGTRTANVEMAASEVQQLAPIALAASENVDRTQYPSLNALELAAKQGTGDENVIRLNQSVNALVNTYARAISPNGTPTVSDKDHAREILDRAYSKGQFRAAIDQMQLEIAAARKAPGSVRGEFRAAISGGAPGMAAVPDAPNSAPQLAAPKSRFKIEEIH